ncbi:phosphonate metabolism protein/1,5-bisphosphokinase (PRPP-forming) PhnN [Noviherbaspirillum sp.]|uniref:phosphonate metabolism protein/1,5-bisphosphokinase (PRPP-forming) PhnN n=1 Tax=Noviherbaspirillum sp. TaxID=1926288 RepID=UPI002FE26D1B
MTRYALYFAPASTSAWWRAGCRWLGRDPESGEILTPHPVKGLTPELTERWSADARRYGFHATLKAPFRLMNGFSETHLLAMAQAFAAVQKPIALNDTRVRSISDFMALIPSGPLEDIGALAMRCVSYFDLLRAPPTPAELARRRHAGLSERQETLLQRWGYPHTEEQFRFHMTLSDSLEEADAHTVDSMRKAAESCFDEAAAHGPMSIDNLAIFREDSPGAPFRLWRRFAFDAERTESTLPLRGRLFFFVGASGVGKDTLLRWLEQHANASGNIVFARRTITRGVHPSEVHEAVDTATFWRQAAAGDFAMMWQANDLCYGIRRGIDADLKAGRDVVVNGSREYIPQLKQMYPDARIIWVEAGSDVIRQRIEARQRESGAALLRRMDRIKQFTPPQSDDVIRVDNSGPLEATGARLLEVFSAK